MFFLSGWIYTLTRFAFLLCKQICSRYTSAAGERIYMMQSIKKVAFSHFFVSVCPRFEPLCLHIDSVIYRMGVQARSRISSALSMEVMRPRRMYRSMKSFRVAPVNSSERPNCRELLIMMFIS